MDYETFDYIPMVGYSNVYRQIPKNQAGGTTQYEPHPYVKPLIDELVMARPNWAFVSHRSSVRQGSTVSSATYFSVEESGEKLGELDVTVANRDGEGVVTYLFDTHRMAQERKRGVWTRTTKLDKAVKDILKAFRPRNITEIIKDRMTDARSNISRRATLEGRRFTDTYDTLENQLTNFVMDKWDTMTAMFDEAGLKYDHLLPELYEAKLKAEEMHSMFRKGDGMTIHIRQSDYVVVRGANPDGSDHIEIRSSDGLPAEVRGKLGMLKLTEGNQFVPDVGMRCAQDTYYVMYKEQKND